MKKRIYLLYMLLLLLCTNMYAQENTITTSNFTVKNELPSRPSIIFPKNAKVFTKKNSQQPIKFLWTRVALPQPNSDVIYHLKLWRFIAGQNAAQVIKNTIPVVEKNINNSRQTNIASSLLHCESNCRFVWTVTATNKDGQPYGESEPALFSIGDNDVDIKIDSLTASCCTKGKQTIKIQVSNTLANANTIVKKIFIVDINGNPASIDISPFCIPAVPSSFLPSLGSTSFVATINCIKNIKTLIVEADGQRMVGSVPLADQDIEYDTLSCPCDACEDMGVTIENATAVISGDNEIQFSALINMPNFSILKKYSAEIVGFDIIQTGDANCTVCTSNSSLFGNFINDGSSSNWDFGGHEYTHIITYTNPGVNPCMNIQPCAKCDENDPPDRLIDPEKKKVFDIINNPTVGGPPANKISNQEVYNEGDAAQRSAMSFQANIAIPPGNPLACCNEEIKICIRFTFTDNCCHTCEKIVCVTVVRKTKKIKTEGGIKTPADINK